MRGVAYFGNGIGNFVAMMPAMQALRDLTGSPVDLAFADRWMDGRRKAVKEIAEAWDVVGKIFDGTAKEFEERAGDYSHFFFSRHNVASDTMMAFQSRARVTAGTPAWAVSLIHEREHYMEAIYSMGYKGPMPNVKFPIGAGPEITGPRPHIGLCNGAFGTEQWIKKRWPHFRPLAEALRGWYGGTIVGIGGEGELDDVAIPEDLNFTGRTSILESAKIISGLDLFITTDTGCMHIADVLGVPMIALFGPTICSKNGPLARGSAILRSGVNCSPCQYTAKFYSCKHYACMENLTPGAVMNAIRRKTNLS